MNNQALHRYFVFDLGPPMAHSCIMLFDLHVHTNFSPCSRLSPAQALARARRLGLDGVCLTDHHSREAARVIDQGPQPDGLVVLVGQEYTTTQGDFLLFGQLPQLAPGLNAPQVLDLVERAGGAAVGAHPCRRGRGLDPRLLSAGLVKVIEGVNGRNLSEENQQAQQLGLRHDLTLVGGSDAHDSSEVGAAATLFEQPVFSQMDLVDALRSGRCQAHWVADLHAANSLGRSPAVCTV